MIIRQFIAGMVALLVSVAAAMANTHIIAIIDTSAFVEDEGEAEIRRKMLLATFLENMPRRSVLSIIDTVSPSVKWHGDAKKAERELDQLLAIMTPNPRGCADLTRALDHAEMAVRRSESKDIRFLMLSPLIHSGAPCGGAVKLPQALPEDAKPERFLNEKRITAWELYAPHELQTLEWFGFLQEAPSNGRVAVRMFSAAESPEALAKLAERD
ncbi:hypothetical protein So717_43150 [Roseobacter cerasinus]|uniref:VWA domain-containing protein n=1 Tax=Roseobacter cerasinus TaxID=2602289 RepID=A0A640VY02_9RHOB|nr:hypothetical protein [Roseobacter cerasinus]GFE52562.1 hypothetical protein So717_43150 [Roseobacter cerasinus]